MRDAIKTVQNNPVKNLKRKNTVKSSDEEKNPETPKPKRKSQKSKARIETDDDLPAPPPKRAVRPALTNEGDDSVEDLQSKKTGKKNKGKGKEIQQPDKKREASVTINADHRPTRDTNVPKAIMSVLFHIHSHVITFVE